MFYIVTIQITKFVGSHTTQAPACTNFYFSYFYVF